MQSCPPFSCLQYFWNANCCVLSAQEYLGQSTMETGTQQPRTSQSFLTAADIELKRAERYRIFVSLLVLDLSFLPKVLGDKAEEAIAALTQLARDRVRCTDSVTLMDTGRVCLLFPETPRQSAMAASRRITDLMRQALTEKLGRNMDMMIPAEITSYPDAAGTKTLAKALQELTTRSRN